MSKSVRVDDDTHMAMSNYKNRTGVPIAISIEKAWLCYAEKTLQLEIEKNEWREVKPTGDVTVLPKVTC